MQLFDLTIVLPVCRPNTGWANPFINNVKAVKELMHGVKIEFIVVNDGFETPELLGVFELLNELHPEINFISYPDNRGKGYALRTGVKSASAPFILTTDIDFPYANKNLVETYNLLKKGKDVVAAKRNREYFKAIPAKRLLLSKTSTFLNRNILRLPDCDAQSGLKGFNQTGARIFLETKTDRFLVDTEFLLLSVQKRLDIGVVNVELKEGIKFSSMGLKVITAETKNFIRIIGRQIDVETINNNQNYEIGKNLSYV